MINIAGVVSIVLFYLLILAVGIWAGRKKEEGNDSEEEVMLAGRSIGLFVGIFTMTGNLFDPVFFISISIDLHKQLPFDRNCRIVESFQVPCEMKVC